jgi:ADP-ribose diphosphatase
MGRHQHDRVVFNHPYFTIREDTNGNGYIQGGDNALVVALTPRGEVFLVAEPSPAFHDETLVLPGGEVSDSEPPAQTANRELQAEIGYKAGRLVHLGQIRGDAKYNTQCVHIFLALDLRRSRLQGDEPYTMRVGRVPLANFEKLIASGKLVDANSIAALYMALSYLRRRAAANLNHP